MLHKRESFSADAIRQALTTQIVGRRVIYRRSIPSTMDVAKREAVTGAVEGTVVIADRQTAGRGRLKRSWLAPAGNVALSVVLYPRISDLPSLTMLASLAVVRSITSVAGIEAGIKWPNDVMAAGKKVSGILIEMDARPSGEGRVAYAVVGIGINVNLDPALFPEIEATATSLSIETGKEVSRVALIVALLTELDGLYLSIERDLSIFEEWKGRLVTLGQRVHVTSVDASYDGIAVSVDRDASLVVRCEDGSARRVIAGDVTLAPARGRLAG